MHAPLRLLAGTAFLAGAVLLAGSSSASDASHADDGLSVAALAGPGGGASRYEPCTCPVCMQIRRDVPGLLLPAHQEAAGVGLV